jgi:hypothetical protein
MKFIYLSVALLAATSVFAQDEVIHTTTTTTTTDGFGDPNGIQMNVNMGGFGTGVQVDVNGTGTSSSTTTRTTTTRSTTTSSGFNNAPPPPPPPRGNGYTGKVGCPYPIDGNDFESISGSIARNDFESTKLQVAKQICDSRCFTSAQVRDLTRLFEFENSRLDFAKYAYKHTYDLSNYYMVNDAFEFENSKTDLSKFVSGGR